MAADMAKGYGINAVPYTDQYGIKHMVSEGDFEKINEAGKATKSKSAATSKAKLKPIEVPGIDKALGDMRAANTAATKAAAAAPITPPVRGPVTSAELAQHKDARKIFAGRLPKHISLDQAIEGERAFFGPMVKTKEELIEKFGGRDALKKMGQNGQRVLDRLKEFDDTQAGVFDIGSRVWQGGDNSGNKIFTRKDYVDKAIANYPVGQWDVTNRLISVGNGDLATNFMVGGGGRNADELSAAYFDPTKKNTLGQDITATRADKLAKLEADFYQRNSSSLPTQNYNKGGIVYAANGALMAAQSRGTDTVPAMLTPGEFVVNREASQKHAPILQAINSGHYDHGGMVNYLNNGGIATTKYFSRGDVVTEDLEKLNEKRRNNGGVSNNGGSGGGILDQLDSLEKRFQSFDTSIASLGEHMGKLETSVGSFGEHSASMSDSVSRFSIAANTVPQPRENIISGNLVTSLDVKHHGLGQMAPALENMILTNSNDQLNQLNRLQEGSLFPGDANATIGKNQQGYA